MLVKIGSLMLLYHVDRPYLNQRSLPDIAACLISSNDVVNEVDENRASRHATRHVAI